jgi:hypothetical protein
MQSIYRQMMAREKASDRQARREEMMANNLQQQVVTHPVEDEDKHEKNRIERERRLEKRLRHKE